MLLSFVAARKGSFMNSVTRYVAFFDSDLITTQGFRHLPLLGEGRTMCVEWSFLLTFVFGWRGRKFLGVAFFISKGKLTKGGLFKKKHHFLRIESILGRFFDLKVPKTPNFLRSRLRRSRGTPLNVLQ